MIISDWLDKTHYSIRQNRWHSYFSIFCRLSLAVAFIPAGLTKIMGERFASGISANHPMGHYLEALFHTGYYYTSIGIAQVLAALLLLIPRTVVLGSLIYLPIIVNICILSFSVRFDGSIVTAPLMVLANLYIMAWNYDRVKSLMPLTSKTEIRLVEKPQKLENKFPFLFFTGVAGTLGIFIAIFVYGYEVMPRNSTKACYEQFIDTKNEVVGKAFCDCIHQNGWCLNDCLVEFEAQKK